MKKRSKKISASIIGLGYVGLPMLHLLSKKKINYYGFEKDINKINLLKKNSSYISDISNAQLKIINKSNLFSLKEIYKIKETDFIILCLPTPLKKKKEPDMSIIKDAFKSIRPYLRAYQTIILESTVYPGATKDIFKKELSKRFDLGKNFFLCYSPERINPGQKNKTGYKYFFENTTKVISGYNLQSLKKIKKIYDVLFKTTFTAKSLEIAEMSKLVENAYRSVNIGLVNELKMICNNLKLNIHNVQDVASSKPFGFTKFTPGPGVGGHCIPIDPIFIDWIARKNKSKASFISLARTTNLRVTSWILRNIYKKMPGVKNSKTKKKILIVGIAYKPNVNDIRESSGIEIFKKIKKLNNQVEYLDNKIDSINIWGKKYSSKNNKDYKKYDAVIICTAHDGLNKKELYKKSKLIFDTRGIFKDYSSKKIIQL